MLIWGDDDCLNKAGHTYHIKVVSIYLSFLPASTIFGFQVTILSISRLYRLGPNEPYLLRLRQRLGLGHVVGDTTEGASSFQGCQKLWNQQGERCDPCALSGLRLQLAHFFLFFFLHHVSDLGYI